MGKPKANCELRRVYLDRGGYEYGNVTYWGHGQPLYRYHYDDGQHIQSGTVRGSDREAAKEAVRKWYPQAVFYR